MSITKLLEGHNKPRASLPDGMKSDIALNGLIVDKVITVKPLQPLMQGIHKQVR